MAIQRWEMLLSAQADSYLLKIQGERADIDRIVQAHPQVCQNVQEISGDVFQWAIFVVGAPFSQRLAIQNLVVSLTQDTSDPKSPPSSVLGDVLDGLSGALQDLTNLTEDEQLFVMNKVARMGPPAPTKSPASSPPVKTVPLSVSPPPVPPLPPVQIPGKVGAIPAPTSPQKTSPIPLNPNTQRPAGGGILPPLPSAGPVPAIVRPVQPPRSFPANPHVPATPGHPLSPGVPLPPVTIPKIPAPVISKPPTSAPASPPSPPIPLTSSPRPAPPPVALPAETAPLPREEPRGPAANPPIEKLEEKPAAPSPSAELVPPVPASPPKADDSTVLRISVFYPEGGEEIKDRFINTLSEMAQKKSKKPTAFQVNISVSTTISLENCTDWIWKAKTGGSDMFFVILPMGTGTDLFEPVVGEAQTAGLRCFLIPQAEIDSRLLYMDLMVELMMFKRRIRPAS